MPTGEKIKEIRKKRGLTQKQLGDLCGMADSAIRRYENGRANPKLETIKKIATALNVSIDVLMTGEPSQPVQTIAAHLDGDVFTPEELEEIRQFAEFVKSKRKAPTLNAAHDNDATPEQKKNADDIMKNSDEWN